MKDKDLRDQIEELFHDIIPEPEIEVEKHGAPLEEAVSPTEAETAEAEIAKDEPMAEDESLGEAVVGPTEAEITRGEPVTAGAPPTPATREEVGRERPEALPKRVSALKVTLKEQCLRKTQDILLDIIIVIVSIAKFARSSLNTLKEAILELSRHFAYIPRKFVVIVALLLVLALLVGLISLISPPLRALGLASAGIVGLLLLLVGLFGRHLKDWLARKRSRVVGGQPGALATAYRHKLITQLNQLKVMDVARPFDMDTSYIPLRVREKATLYSERSKATALSSYSRERRGEVMSPQRALARFHHLVLLGEPGVGKTTLLRRLALQAARGELEDLPDFPIFISLSHFAADASDFSLLDFVIKEIDALSGSSTMRPESADGLRFYLEERLEEGSVLLLLDGLDEIGVGNSREAMATYRHMVGQINVLTARYPKVPVVATSRRASWKGLLSTSFHALEVLRLEQDDIRLFIEGWLDRGSNRTQELQRTISQNPQVRAMAANPLLLSLMALVFEHDEELPEGRAGLYGRGMELLFEKWENSRGHRQLSRFTAEHQRDLLKEVALHFHLRRNLCFPKYDLSGVTASYLSAVGLPAEWFPSVLERLSAQYGLLKEQTPEWYSFPHLAWQEYFVAMAISERGLLELALEGVSDPWWEGTILFLAEMLEDVTPLLEGILDQEDDIFHTNLLLAGRCLAGKSRITQASLKESIIERLRELVEGEYHLPLRQWAIGVLAEIDGPSNDGYFMSLVTDPIEDEMARTVHRWVTTALASLGDESTANNLMALLSNEEIDLAVRINVAVALGSLGHGYVIPQFLALLPDEEVDYRVRMAVVGALGALSTCPEHSRKGESITSQLLRILPDEKVDYRVRVRAAEVLGAIGDDSITSSLLRLLESEKVDYSVRMTVAETLGSLGDKSISGRLLAMLPKKKLDPDVRASIAAALGSLGDISVIPELLQLLPNEKMDPSIRWRIIDSLCVLGAMDDGACAPDLLALLSNEEVESSVRMIVAESMGQKTVTPLLPASRPARGETAEFLRSLGDRSKIPQLLTLLPDREIDRSMRLKAVEAIGALGDDRVTAERLAGLLDDEEIGSDVYQALFQVSQRVGVRIFAKNGGEYEIR